MRLLASVEFTRKTSSGALVEDFTVVQLLPHTPAANIAWCATCAARDALRSKNLRAVKFSNVTAWTEL